MFLHGLLIGIIFGIPAGAIGALTINRTIRFGFMAGLITGLGSSAADLIYAIVGAFGITIVSDFLTANTVVLSFISGILILVMAVFVMKKEAIDSVEESPRRNLPALFGGSFMLAILNPATIATFMIAFSASGIAAGMTGNGRIEAVLGILTGTVFWWLMLSGITSIFKHKVTPKILTLLNRILGILLVLFGILCIFRAFSSYQKI